MGLNLLKHVANLTNMSSNDYLYINKKNGKYVASHCDYENDEVIEHIGEFNSLESAVIAIRNYEQERTFAIEYGLKIDI